MVRNPSVVQREQILAFRAARQGLVDRDGRTLADAAACPLSDFQPGSALIGLAARSLDVTREGYGAATDSGELAVGHSLRAALHATTPEHARLFGRALVATDPGDLLDQLGEQAKRVLGETGIDPRDALDEVARASAGALVERSALDRNELHEELRGRVRPELKPWCRGCKSHHVMPMLWRYALVAIGARRDSRRRYVAGDGDEAPPTAEAVRRFLRFYGPATPADFGTWARLGRAQARRLWAEVEGELAEVEVDGRRAFLLSADRRALESPPEVRGLRLLAPGDPFLQAANRALLFPDADVRKRAFRSVASPGVVLQDGEAVGLWRMRARGTRVEIELEELKRAEHDALAAEAELVARLRGAEAAVLSFR